MWVYRPVRSPSTCVEPGWKYLLRNVFFLGDWTHLITSAFETTFPPFPLFVDTGSYWITQYINVHFTTSHISQQKLSSDFRTTSDDTHLNQTFTQIKPKMINRRLSHNIGYHLEPTLVNSGNDIPQHLNCKRWRHKKVLGSFETNIWLLCLWSRIPHRWVAHCQEGHLTQCQSWKKKESQSQSAMKQSNVARIVSFTKTYLAAWFSGHSKVGILKYR